MLTASIFLTLHIRWLTCVWHMPIHALQQVKAEPSEIPTKQRPEPARAKRELGDRQRGGRKFRSPGFESRWLTPVPD